MTEPAPARNLFQTLERAARAHPSHIASRSRRGGSWEWTTWGDFHEVACALGAALGARGVVPGDSVVLFSSSREEWTHADFGILSAGAVTVPIYPTSTKEQAGFILKDSGAKVAFVEGRRQLEVVKEALDAPSELREIVVLDSMAAGVKDGDTIPGRDIRVTPYAVLVKAGRALAQDPTAAASLPGRHATPEDLATIVYTSGTTGEARGAMLTHGCFLSEIGGLTEAFRIGPTDEQLLLLPLAHILARILVFTHVVTGSRLAYSTDPHRFSADLAEVEPTFFAAVPRFFEKVHAVANQSAKAQGPLKAALWSWATNVGREAARASERGKPLRGLLAAEARYADGLVLGRVRKTFGKRLRFAISGGAPLARELGEWFQGCGILVLEGYGLTEVTGASHVNRESRRAFGTVGLPIAGVEARIGADGEVLLRGPTLMKGYHGNAEATRAAIDDEGWFHTGDIGRIDAGGFLTIVDRKKDVIVTAGGSNVSPQNIEGLLSASPWVSHAVVFGDRKPYLVALVTLDVAGCRRWANEHKRASDVAHLAEDSELRALIQIDVDAVNHKLASYETIKRFAVLDRELSVEAGELTDTLKVKRRVVEQRFAEIIQSLYEG